MMKGVVQGALSFKVARLQHVYTILTLLLGLLMTHPRVARQHGPEFTLTALFVCIFTLSSAQTSASEGPFSDRDALSTQEVLFAEDRLKATREHWLRSKLEFSGRTNKDADGLDGALNLGVKDLFGNNHRADLKYTDSRAFRASNERRVLGFGYGMPVGRNHLNMELTNTAYDEVSKADGGGSRRQGESGMWR